MKFQAKHYFTKQYQFDISDAERLNQTLLIKGLIEQPFTAFL